VRVVARLLVVGAVVAALAGAAVGRAGEPQPVTATTFAITGHGWGHGVGMSQWGACGYAQDGATYEEILAHYYPTTQLSQAPAAKLRVLLAERKKLTIASAEEFRVEDASGAAQTLAAGSYPLDATLELPDGTQLEPPLVFRPGRAPLRLGRLYRGSIEISLTGNKVSAVNVVGLDSYVRGVVSGEMPKDWPLEALKAQAVAARSYALAARRRGGSFDLYPDTRDQVYGGIAAETPATDEAVLETKGQVLVSAGKVATTYFFSSSGGRTAAIADVFPEKPAEPYLVSVRDPYDTMSPWHDWGPVVLTGAQLAKKLGVRGVSDLQTAPASGRARAVTVSAASGAQSVSAGSVRSALGLRSTWFQVSVLSLSRPRGMFAPGEAVPLSGVARRVSVALLEQKPSGGAWEAGPAIDPAADGSFAVTVQANATTLYRLVGDGVASTPLRLPVSADQ
jgi:stage II sporulation protein D